MKGRPVAALVVAGLVLAGCGGGTPRPEVALPGRPHIVEVEMLDHSFRYPPDVRSGRVLFRITNAGTVPHSLSLLPLPEDLPPIDQQLRGTERRAIPTVAAIHAKPPGGRTTLAADLTSGGRYALICFLDDPAGVSHALQGMNSEFRASPAP